MSTKNETVRRSKAWLATPAVAVVGGIAYFMAGWLGGDHAFAFFGLALMWSCALALVLVRGRSETIRGLLDHRDERLHAIDVRATAFAGVTVLVVDLVAFVVELARGHDGSPYSWLAAVGGASYLLAVIVLVRRG